MKNIFASNKSEICIHILLVLTLLFVSLPAIKVEAASSCTPGKQVDKNAFFTAVANKIINPSIPSSEIARAVQAFIAWEPYENTNACWNPLATTLSKTGSTNFNSVGVKNYPDFATGVQATADTLNYTFSGRGAYYAPIRKMMAMQEFDETAIKNSLKGWVGSEAYSSAVTAKWKELYKTQTYASVWASQSAYPTLTQGESAEVWLAFKNIGNVSWKNTFTPNRTHLGTLNPTTGAIDYVSPFVCTPGWIGNARPAILSEASVAPGETGTFKFRICAPSNLAPGVYRLRVAPLVEYVSWMLPPTSVYLDVTVKAKPSVQPCSVPTGQFCGEYYNNRFLSGSPTFVRNTSSIDFPWGDGGPGNGVGPDNFSVRWQGIFSFENANYTITTTADDGIRLYVDNVLKAPTNPKQDPWRDQGTTTYTYDLSLSGGYHTIKVEYYENGGGAVAQVSWVKKEVKIYASELVSKSANPIVIQGESAEMTVGVKNIGNTTWVNSGRNRTHLGTLEPTTGAPDYVTPFLCSPQWVGNNRPAILSEASVTPGGTGTFRFRICVPSNLAPGVYKLRVAPLVEYVSWMIPPTPIYWDVTVKAKPGVQLCSMPTGQFCGEYYNNRFLSGSPTFVRNTSSIDFPWGDGGPGNGVGPDNFSVRWQGIFSFENANYTITTTADDGIRLYVDNVLKAPTNPKQDPWRDQGTTTYNYDLSVSAGNHTIKVEYYENGGGAVAQVSWAKKVSKIYASELVSKSANPTIIQGGSAEISVGFKNIGNTIWGNTGLNRTHLGTLEPTTGAPDYVTPFLCSPQWVGNNRPAILSESSVAPGGTGTFKFRICVPSNLAPGVYKLRVAPLVEYISWMIPLTPVYWDVTVKAKNPVVPTPDLNSAREQLKKMSTMTNPWKQIDAPLKNASPRSSIWYAAVIDQFDVAASVFSGRYAFGSGSNAFYRCNIFAGDVMRAMNAPIPTKGELGVGASGSEKTDPMTANAAHTNDFLNGRSTSTNPANSGWREVDMTKSEGLNILINHVNAGKPALASRSDHIAVIRPDQTNVTRWQDLRAAQAGAKLFLNGTLSDGFGSTNRPQFFIHD